MSKPLTAYQAIKTLVNHAKGSGYYLGHTIHIGSSEVTISLANGAGNVHVATYRVLGCMLYRTTTLACVVDGVAASAEDLAANDAEVNQVAIDVDCLDCIVMFTAVFG